MSEHDDLGEHHERTCCDSHYLHGCTYYTKLCWTCERVVVETLTTLAHNLAWAASLCRAHDIGMGSGYEWATRKPFYPRWEPGIGSDASKAEEARKQPGAFADIYGDRSKWRAP